MRNRFITKPCVRAAVALALSFVILNLNGGAQRASCSVQEKSVAIKVLEIGKVSDKRITKATENFWNEYDFQTPLYIINYGTNKEIARRERLIMNVDIRHEEPRITLVRGGLGQGPKTVIWKVPAGADNPAP